MAAAGARVHPPDQTRPLARREGAAGQWQRQRSRGDRGGDDKSRWQPRPRPRCAKRHGLPHDAPRPRAGKQRHAASRLPTTRGPLAARVKSPPIPRPSWRAASCCAAMAAIRAARTGWTPSAASHPPPRHGTLALVASAPERRARRRHQSVCATCGQTAETTFRPDPTRPVYCDGCYHDVRETRRAAVASPAV